MPDFTQALPSQREDESLPVRKRHAKLFHKKSRTGCQRCRIRRVKCDEGKPICNNCTRLDLECAYGTALSPSSQGDSPPSQSSSKDEGHGFVRAAEALGETEARRKMEIELFYHYTTEAGPSVCMDKESLPFWTTVMCRAGLQSDAVLYSICLLAALHKAHKSKSSAGEPTYAESAYLNLTLQEHHKHVAHLTAENVDFSCLASSALRVYSFMKLQHRPLQPYTPPTEWLRMSNTSNITFRKALALAKINPSSVGSRMIMMISHLIDEKHSLQHTKELMHLMRRQEPHELVEEWDEEISETYKRTLSCIGGTWKHRFDSEPPAGLARRVILFPMLVDKKFIDLVVEMQPRALVILAHYFALLLLVRRVWYVGDAGFREVWAIAAHVPKEWQGMLIQPLEMLKDPALLCNVQTSATG